MEDQNQNNPQVVPSQDEMTEEEKKKQAGTAEQPPVEAPASDMPQQQ